MLATTTEEEANCLPWPWIKQRSRWLKGYMTTYLVHMRRPGLLLRQLGVWKFLGFQAHFVSALSQVFLAPVLWSFWLVLLGLPHPLDPYVAPGLMTALGSAFPAIEVVNLTIHASAVTGARHRHLLAWTPTMHFYVPLGTWPPTRRSTSSRSSRSSGTRPGTACRWTRPGRARPSDGALDLA